MSGNKVEIVRDTLKPEAGGIFECETPNGSLRLIYPHRDHIHILRPDNWGDYEVCATLPVGTPRPGVTVDELAEILSRSGVLLV